MAASDGAGKISMGDYVGCIADARFKVLREFEIPTLAGPKVLLEGREYVIDAKSKPVRAKTDYRMKKTLMRALHNIEIIEV